MTLTQERLKELLAYDASTGVFTWKATRSTVRAGDVAGGAGKGGYRSIKVGGKLYPESWLVWLYMTGSFPQPPLCMDHKNGEPSDNRFCNLRAVTQRENHQNRPEHRKGQLAGVTFRKDRKKWRASIEINRKRKHLGYFLTELEAHNAYVEACKQLEA